MTEAPDESRTAEGRRMMLQYVGQKVPIHAGAPDGPVIGEATIVGIDWEREAFLADFDNVPTPVDPAAFFTNVTCEAHS